MTTYERVRVLGRYQENDADEERALIRSVKEYATEYEHEKESAAAVYALLGALQDALTEDMEQGAAWMNDAAHAEFKRKYPRFVTLFNIACNVKWNKV